MMQLIIQQNCSNSNCCCYLNNCDNCDFNSHNLYLLNTFNHNRNQQWGLESTQSKMKMSPDRNTYRRFRFMENPSAVTKFSIASPLWSSNFILPSVSWLATRPLLPAAARWQPAPKDLMQVPALIWKAASGSCSTCSSSCATRWTMRLFTERWPGKGANQSNAVLQICSHVFSAKWKCSFYFSLGLKVCCKKGSLQSEQVIFSMKVRTSTRKREESNRMSWRRRMRTRV